MQRFDCLDPNTNVLGDHFLEASAGTGKTFAIEQVVGRLIQERSLSIEQILVVTFTRAATRELKARIRANLARLNLQDALFSFDRCQIFTIHGFCSKMLSEEKPFLKEESSPYKIELALKKFFEFELSSDILSPEQLKILVHWAGSVEKLSRRLQKRLSSRPAKSVKQRWEEFLRVLETGPSRESIREEFEAHKEDYKSAVKGNFLAQVDALQQKDFASFCLLLKEKGSLFSFFSPENRRVKAKAPTPFFFQWGLQHLLPLIEEALKPQEIFQSVLAAWEPIFDRILEEEGIENPDKLLIDMQKAVQESCFVEKIQKKYRAVLIDEFQDTDPIQWNIFNTLFSKKMDAFYLIGDPKQSIYRFRNADLYTYLAAKQTIDPSGHFFLDTNFRSSKQLIGALNRLLDRNWLKLPQLKQNLLYIPLQAGLPLETQFLDQKKALHCLLFNEEEALFSHIAQEILRLKEEIKSLSSFAVLVKDRYQAAKIEHALQQAGIPIVSRSQELLVDTLAFQAVEELFQALHHPRHLGLARTVLAGPFARLSVEELSQLDDNPLSPLRDVLQSEGLAVFFQSLLQTRLSAISVQERSVTHDSSFYTDLRQVFETLLEWERKKGFSFEGLFRFFAQMHQTDPDEAIRKPKNLDANGVQILTMHKSKGLEFEIVFAVGVSARTQTENEEAEAEKLRQFYVAITRAKKRLYLPIPLDRKTEETAPIELFCQCLSPADLWQQELFRLSSETDLSIETVANTTTLSMAPIEQKKSSLILPKPLSFPIQPSYVLSFSSLAKPTIHPLPSIDDVKPLYTPNTLPRGAETGTLIHRIFERALRESISIETLVEQELQKTTLQPWTKTVIEMVRKSFQLPLEPGFCIADIDPAQMLVESEFLFQQGDHFLKGVVDLLFVWRKKLYFVDWKTNWLEEYSKETMRASMNQHQYTLQASIYKEALQRSWQGEFGAGIYLFVRGPNALCFNPENYGH
ncbi:MAG TPA: UvrD-helicase domain-containing protein [Chlamydiales bacterium]|jgi:exodeoxyribonuclease V beta subunit